jgi:hypothetical protein
MRKAARNFDWYPTPGAFFAFRCRKMGQTFVYKDEGIGENTVLRGLAFRVARIHESSQVDIKIMLCIEHEFG